MQESEMDAMQPRDGNRFAFVLMPFDPEFSRIYEELVKPALEDEGFEVRRADDTFDQQNILRTIVHNISVADLIVADLTASNPNVFYELGIAHALSQKVVLLSQELEQVPFDLRSYTIVTYSLRFDEVQKLKDRLRNIARGLKEGSVRFGSPVSDFAPSVEKERSSISIEPTPQEEVEQEPEGEDSGLLDFIAEVEDSLVQIGTTVERFTETMERFGQRITELAVEAESVSTSGTSGRAVRMRKLARTMASEIKGFGKDIQAELPDFHRAWERMEKYFTKLIDTTEIKSAEEREEAIKEAITLRSQLGELQAAIDPGLEALQEVRNELATNTGLSRDLNVAIRGTVRAMDNLIEELSTGESSVTRMMNLLEQKLQPPA